MHVPCLLDVVASEVHPVSPRIVPCLSKDSFDMVIVANHLHTKKKKNVYFFLLRLKPLFKISVDSHPGVTVHQV